jgi:cyclomaltodextrinase / maltogenic alpha-amylase / neopullulanase
MNPAKGKPVKDHIFGDLDQPSNSVRWMIDRHRGDHHYHRMMPLRPKPGDIVDLYLTTSMELNVESVMVWITTDDWQHHSVHQLTKQQTTWSTALWSYLQEWMITLPSQPAGTMLRYKIGAKLQGSSKVVFADSQSEDFETATHFSIWYGEDALPDWAESAVIYQIFVDRFNPGQERSWDSQTDLKKPFGGTLQGITEKMPFIKSMGFNTIWLTPIFDSPSHHGYDISDYYQIHPRLGSMEDFMDLLKVAHQHQIRVMLDFVANHCSSEHPFFRDAVRNPESPYHDYFVWKDWPDYESFYNVRTMPKLNLAYGSPARDFLLKCAQSWLEKGVDGFRLDYAHGPEQDFWVDFRRACTAVNPEVWTFAEIVQPPDVQASYADGVGGALDFLLCQALRLTFGQHEWPLDKFASFLQNHFDYFPEGFSLPAFLDNHDMNRFLVISEHGEKLLRMALMVLYTLPGPPIIYYGTEVPLSQRQSIHDKGAQGFDESRLPMDWDAVEKSNLPGYMAKLAEIRQTNPEIYQLGWKLMSVGEYNDFIVLTKTGGRDLFLLINRSKDPIRWELKDHSAQNFYDLVDGTHFTTNHGRLALRIEPCSAMLILAINN